MRRLRAALLAAVTLAVGGTLVGLAGCPAAHDAFPGTACTKDSDCYVGEKCMNSTVCVATGASTDMAVPPTVDDMTDTTGGDS